MQTKQLLDAPQRVFALVFDPGEAPLEGLLAFAKEQRLDGGSFTGLGAFSRCVLGYFDLQRKDYKEVPIDEQVEVLNLTGNVALANGEPKLHPHVVLGKADGSAWGGHLLRATVQPTLEVIVTEQPSHLRRFTDEATGLPLLRLR